MSAVTYSPKTLSGSTVLPGSAKSASEAGRKGFFARLLAAMVAARMEQAEREYARYVEIHGRDPIA